MATKFGGRTVSGKFGVTTGADEGSITKTVAPAKLSDVQMNTKIKARFGINTGMPKGVTFQAEQKDAFDNPDTIPPYVAVKSKKTPAHDEHSFLAVGTKK